MERQIQIVALYRLSKETITRNGKTASRGLSIEAQRSEVKAFADCKGMVLAKEFTELISGRKKERPILQEALDYCIANKAVLVIARLDRLSRRVALISALLESRINFRVVQFPDIDPKENPFFFQVLAAVSELEVKYIRERTKAALKAKKSRGEELGTYGKNILSKVNKHKADDFALCLYPIIEKLQNRGFLSIRDLARELNRRKVPTYRKNGKWYSTTVFNLLQRIKEKASSNQIQTNI